VTLLEDLVDENKRFERLDLIGENGLPAGVVRARLGPGRRMRRAASTYTLMPCQKLWELLWSHVYTMQARTCFPTRGKRAT
jgi:hypothetical protein